MSFPPGDDSSLPPDVSASPADAPPPDDTPPPPPPDAPPPDAPPPPPPPDAPPPDDPPPPPPPDAPPPPPPPDDPPPSSDAPAASSSPLVPSSTVPMGWPGTTNSSSLQTADNGPSKSSNTPLIAGVSVGIVLFVVLLVLLLVYFVKKKDNKENPLKASDADESSGCLPFGCCQITIQLPPASNRAIQNQQQPTGVRSAAPRAHGAQAQNVSRSPTGGSPLLPVIQTFHSSKGIKSISKEFTYEELELATNGFSEENFLGKGGFGHVYKGVLPDLKEVAVKQLNIDGGQGEREFDAEVETIGRVHHKNLVGLVGYSTKENTRMLVYEFVPNNTLYFHLHEGQPILAWNARMKIALGSAKGISYLHEECSPKIIHRDIKAANILLDSNYEVKVADFGLAKLSPDGKTHVSTRVMGTFGYLAPEYANNGKITEKSDVYSFGVILLEIITGHKPTTSIINALVAQSRPLLLQSLRDGNFDPFVDEKLDHNYNIQEMKHMIACATACTNANPHARPNMTQVVRVLEGMVSEDFIQDVQIENKNNVVGYDKSESMKSYTTLSQEHTSSEYSIPSTEHGPYLSLLTSNGR